LVALGAAFPAAAATFAARGLAAAAGGVDLGPIVLRPGAGDGPRPAPGEPV